MNRTERFSKSIALVMDIDYDLECGPHTPEIIDAKIQKLADLGFRRLQVIIPPPGFPNYNSSSVFINNNPNAHFHLESVLNTANPVIHYINAAHKYGMSIYAVLKPYEGGGSYSLPHGCQPLLPRNNLEQLGGVVYGYDYFIAKHPEMRVKRRQIPDYTKQVNNPVNMIELAFCIDEIKQKITPKEFKIYNKIDVKQSVKDLTLWTSNDNGKYVQYDSKFDITETIESRLIKDINGLPLYEKTCKCRIIKISNLYLKNKYFAVCFDNQNKKHLTLPYSMIKIFAADGSIIPSTISSRIRNKPVITNSMKTFGGSGDFRDSGFEFQALDTIYCGNGWETNSCYGIAKGKLKYMKGAHCEAYPEVRSFWLTQVKKLLDIGVDGIDIRLACHSVGVVDFINYGFNEPIISEFKEKYGRKPDNSLSDYKKIMQIRGEFFEIFLEDTAQILKSHNKTFMVHLFECYETEKMGYNFNDACFWAMPKILLDWKKIIDLADEITLKDYNWGSYCYSKANKIKNYAHEKNKPLWIMCYLQQGDDLNVDFCTAANNDKRIHGIQLYEAVCNKMPNVAKQEANGIIGVSPDGKIFLNNKTLKTLKILRLLE